MLGFDVFLFDALFSGVLEAEDLLLEFLLGLLGGSYVFSAKSNLFLKPFEELNIVYEAGQKGAYLWSQRFINRPFHMRLDQFVFYHVVLLVLFVLFPQDGLLGDLEDLGKVLIYVLPL